MSPRFETGPGGTGGNRDLPKVGVEPTRPYEHYTLNVARLPIPPLRRVTLINCKEEAGAGQGERA